MSDSIQRYMNLPKFLYLLQNSSLFLPKMSIFSDHLEGGLSPIDFFHTSNHARILDVALNGFWPAANETAESREKRLEEAHRISQEIHGRTFSTPFGDYPCDDIETLFPRCREWIYVSCWHQSVHECSAMWQLYGAEANSVCIFTTTDELKKQTSHGENTNTLFLEQVRYLNDASDASYDNAFSPFLSKAHAFSFEKEVRLVGLDSRLNLSEIGKNENFGVNIKIKSLSKLIKRIVISPNADSWFLDSVQKLCNSFNLGVTVEESSLSTQRVETFWNAVEQIQKAGEI